MHKLVDKIRILFGYYPREIVVPIELRRYREPMEEESELEMGIPEEEATIEEITEEGLFTFRTQGIKNFGSAKDVPNIVYLEYYTGDIYIIKLSYEAFIAKLKGK